MNNKHRILKELSKFVCLELCKHGKEGKDYNKCKTCIFPSLINSLLE